jgi:tRNA 2-thiocytidine biosynthesis protein TtcA
MGRCIADYELIEPGDRVMVAISGGKDSYTLLHLLERARQRAPVPFEIIAVHLDQGQPGYDGTALQAWLYEQGYEHQIVRKDTYQVVTKVIPEGQTYCSMCSRLRRGILYNVAQSLGCTKIALGHHRDDAIETLMLNMMFNGSLSAMPAKLVSGDGRNTVIRPLLYSSERDIAAYSEQLDFPIIPCNLCGSQDNLWWRQQVKEMLDDIEKRAPQVRQSMLAALKNVHTSHLLGTS